MPLKPADVSPREWAQLEIGFTELGLQVWCKRCEVNVVHVDFEGCQHPVNKFPTPEAEARATAQPGQQFFSE